MLNPSHPKNRIILVTGPASSGKSEWAEFLAAQTEKPVCYVATARVDAEDDEWRAKIEKHVLRRPSDWQTRVVPVELSPLLDRADPSSCLLVDSLGTWVANCLEDNEEAWRARAVQLLASLQTTDADTIWVAEETGWGVVPAYASGRAFRDRLGRLTREIGAIATTVYLVVGGYVLDLTQLGRPLPRNGGIED